MELYPNIYSLIFKKPVLINILAVFSILFSLSYYLLSFKYSTSYTVVLKVLSIVCLILIVAQVSSINLLFKSILLLALCFHVIGDLAIERTDNLLYCMPFFLMGHLLYSFLFISDICMNGDAYSFFNSINIQQYAVVILLILPSIFIINLILTSVNGVMFYGVFVYSFILILTVILSAIHPAYIPYLLIGMLCYAVSDAIIGYSSFVSPSSFQLSLTWPLYYVAQVMVVTGLLSYQVDKMR